MDHLRGRLRIAVMDCPYETWDDPRTKELFHKVIRLKLKGYQREYPPGVLPVDTTDFIAAHHLICIEQEGSIEPVMAYRTVTLERCRRHRIGFPALTLMKLMGEREHEAAIAAIIGECDRQGKGISYSSGLSADWNYAGHPEVRAALKTIHVLYHQEERISEIVTGGVIRFKVDKLCEFFGYDRLALDGKALGPVRVPFVFDEPTAFYHLTGFSAAAREVAEKNRELWDRRVVIRADTRVPEKRAA